jgi:hypothetical protein
MLNPDCRRGQAFLSEPFQNFGWFWSKMCLSDMFQNFQNWPTDDLPIADWKKAFFAE